MMKAISLKYRIAVTVFVLEAIMMLIVLTQTLSFSQQASKDQFQVTEGIIVELLKQVAKNALFIGEYDELHNYIHQVTSDPRIARIVILDATQVVASSNIDDLGATQIKFIHRPEHVWRISAIENPIEQIGKIAVEFSNHSLSEIMQNARQLGFSIAIIGMLVIAFVGVVLGHFLTRRLTQLTLTVEQFSTGDLSIRANIPGSDEVATVALTFDRMAAKISCNIHELQEKRAALAQARDRLEEKVLERTKALDASKGNKKSMNGKKIKRVKKVCCNAH